jgi:hypothetical protein
MRSLLVEKYKVCDLSIDSDLLLYRFVEYHRACVHIEDPNYATLKCCY